MPIAQQAQLDYINDPARRTRSSSTPVEEYDTGWVYTEGVAEYSVQTQQDLGLVGNGPDDTLGNFDLDRVQELIDHADADLHRAGHPPKACLTPVDLCTND